MKREKMDARNEGKIKNKDKMRTRKVKKIDKKKKEKLIAKC